MKKILIVEDEKANIRLFERILSDYNLVIFEELNNCLAYIKSGSFNVVDLCIIDINIGTGLKIGGLNVVYSIIRKKPSMPILIVTGYYENKDIIQKIELIRVTLVPKPFKAGEFLDTVKSLLAFKRKFKISDFEQAMREFITGANYLKSLISNDVSIPVEYMNKILEIEDIEEKILNTVSEITVNRNKGVVSCNANNSRKIVDELEMYIKKFISILEQTLYNELNLPAHEMQLVEDVISSGEKLLNDVKLGIEK
mgnify:CR=1 FL=1